jgi:hypothetical protein
VSVVMKPFCDDAAAAGRPSGLIAALLTTEL